VNGNLSGAFEFVSFTRSRSSRRRRNGADSGGSSSGTDDESGVIAVALAKEGSLWNRAQDFWHVVGWAFNCSVCYTDRWKYWKVWLEYMFDVLDADWKERERQDREDNTFKLRLQEDPEAECEYKMLQDSLLVKYLLESMGKSSALKRIIRAAFADGDLESMRAYPEVFENETKERKLQTGQKRKRGHAVDLLKDKYGDYDDDEIEDPPFDFSQPTESNSPPSNNHYGDSDAVPSLALMLGGPESVLLRQRMLTLLSRVSVTLPESFAKAVDVYNIYYEAVKPLPLATFSLLVLPSSASCFPPEVLSSLAQLLLVRLLPNTAPCSQSISHREDDSLSQDILEQCFLPFSANTSSVEDNAKVSLLVESLFRLFLRSYPVYHTPSLEEAIEKGVQARENKIKNDKRKKENGLKRKEEENDRLWLRASGERLRSLLILVERKNASS